MKTLKMWLSAILTALLVFVMFGVIFVPLGLASPGPSFYTELLIVTGLMIQVKLWWYAWAEDKKLNEEEIKEKERTFADLVDKTVEDRNELEEYLKLLTQENRKFYVDNHIEGYNPKGKIYAIRKRFFTILSYILVPKLKGSDLVTLASSKHLYDTKNHRRKRKIVYQTGTTLFTTVLVIAAGNVMFNELQLSWSNVFRFLLYLFTITWTIFTTVIYAYRTTEEETLDHLFRLQDILQKYISWKKEVANG